MNNRTRNLSQTFGQMLFLYNIVLLIIFTIIIISFLFFPTEILGISAMGSEVHRSMLEGWGPLLSVAGCGRKHQLASKILRVLALSDCSKYFFVLYLYSAYLPYKISCLITRHREWEGGTIWYPFPIGTPLLCVNGKANWSSCSTGSLQHLNDFTVLPFLWRLCFY